MSAPHPALLDVGSGVAVGVGDEPAFLASAAEHRMVGAVLAAQRAGKIALSEGSMLTLGAWELGECYRHQRMWGTIASVHRQLGGLGIEVAILKGLATEARWYERMGQRICTDVDVLLAPHALASVADVIATLDPARAGLDTITGLVGRRLLQHIDLRVDDTQVDLHFDPLKIGLPTRQLHQVWATTELMTTPHGTIRVLSPEIELVLLLLHLNKDRFAYLGTFLDVRELLEGTAVDWDAVERFVAGEGLAIPVWNSLATVADVLRIPAPTGRPSGARAWTWRRIWGGAAALGGHEGRRGAPRVQRLLPFHAQGRSVDILREASRQLLPPRPLLEVAGRLEPGASYLRYVAIDRFRDESARNRAATGADSEATGSGGDG